MRNNTINSILFNCIKLLCMAGITMCVIPGYMLLGNLPAQIFASSAACLVCLLLFDLIFKVRAEVFSYSLIVMTVFWVTVAIIKQISLQITNGSLSVNWFHLFYYDRPAMLFVVQFTCMLYFIVKLIKNQNNNEFVSSYKRFIHNTTVCFIVYYVIVLIYCFILVREITFNRPMPNLIPFDTIITSFSLGRIDYELLFLFLGNIAIFFPLGIFVSAVVKSKVFIIVFPFFLSSGIEFSQYLLGNGHPDIDDVILNVLGFYLGFLVYKLTNYVLIKASDGRLKSFFIF